MSERADVSPNLTEQGRGPAIARVATELIAWVAAPWALVSWSVAAAVIAVVVLIGVPSIFVTRGDKKQVLVAVPGWATIAMMVVLIAAAVLGAWFAWPAWVAVLVTALAVATVGTELPRWRWLARAP
ncbi:hypothetical protein [Nocardia sp. MDA0666]|uniref:hypothetical protein n=1 Tax=Nocardia sp. MDA0666 TaxID=2135448 RepID=UPI0018EAB616|nr:hypothetical protein [Nocardia sp. MDA0666]